VAFSRRARERGAMEQTDEKAALAKILEILNKAWPIHNKAKEAVVA
jgi:CarD family transcriptional regulator